MMSTRHYSLVIEMQFIITTSESIVGRSMNTDQYFESDKEMFESVLNRIDKMLEQMQNDKKELAEERRLMLTILEKIANKI